MDALTVLTIDDVPPTKSRSRQPPARPARPPSLLTRVAQTPEPAHDVEALCASGPTARRPCRSPVAPIRPTHGGACPGESDRYRPRPTGRGASYRAVFVLRDGSERHRATIRFRVG